MIRATLAFSRVKRCSLSSRMSQSRLLISTGGGISWGTDLRQAEDGIVDTGKLAAFVRLLFFLHPGIHLGDKVVHGFGTQPVDAGHQGEIDTQPPLLIVDLRHHVRFIGSQDKVTLVPIGPVEPTQDVKTCDAAGSANRDLL